jgi:hypothetical protein
MKSVGASIQERPLEDCNKQYLGQAVDSNSIFFGPRSQGQCIF